MNISLTQFASKKARIICSQDSSELKFHYNPSTINFSKSAKYMRNPNQTAACDPIPSFQGVTATYLQMQILLDAVEKQPFGDVQSEVDQLLNWTLPTEQSLKDNNPSPPTLQFLWGKLKVAGGNTFIGQLEQITVNFQMFGRSGVPLRAMCQISIAGVTEVVPYTNPSSGAENSRRSHILRSGESLQSVAYLAYGDAGRWRDIATVNGIDDPSRVPAGRELLLPEQAELRRAR